jgi:hypothetical protein
MKRLRLFRAAVGSLGLFALAACSAGKETETPDTTAEGTGGGDVLPGSGGTDASAGGTGTGGNGSGGTATGGVGSGGVDTGSGGQPPLEECATPSIDRLQQWIASGEGPTEPATGTLLVEKDGGGYVAEAAFTSASEWHVLVVWLGNEFGASIDLTASSGFTLTYSSTAEFFIQLRPASAWSGGAKWHMPIPNSNGQVVTQTFPFEADQWIQKLGTPPHTFEEALADASGFVIVGNTINELTFHSLRIDGFEPPCL